jgi:hypothetical protein
MFHSHYNYDGNVPIIPFIMGIHQNDLLGNILFVLTHLKALRFIVNNFPSYLFESITNDSHFINPPPSILSFKYEKIYTKFHAINLFI